MGSLIDDRRVADLFSMSRSWIRQERFRRRHGQSHVLDIDPVLVGTTPRYMCDEIEGLIKRLAEARSTERAKP